MSDRTNNGGDTQVCCCLGMPLEGPGRCWAACSLLLQVGPRNPHFEQGVWGLSRGACGVLLSQLWGELQGCRQSMHGSGQTEPVHREHSAWATSQSLCPVGSVQAGPFLLGTFRLQGLKLQLQNRSGHMHRCMCVCAVWYNAHCMHVNADTHITRII